MKRSKSLFYIYALSLIFLTIKLEGQTNQNLGYASGNGGSYNTSIGYYAGDKVTGSYNSMLGAQSGRYTTSGSNNCFFGRTSGYKNTTGNYNNFNGAYSGYNNTTGSNNCFMGASSGRSNTTGSNNICIGYNAGYKNSSGRNNVTIGYQAGYNSTGTSNVFLGYQAGYNETGSNKLYIDNSNTTEPLIYGDFSEDKLIVNEQLGINCDPGTSTLKAYGEYNSTFQFTSASARLQIALATDNNAFYNSTKAGDAIISNLGGLNNTLLYIPNSNNNGASYIGFGDKYNGTWMKIQNNKKVRIEGSLYAQQIQCKVDVWSDFVFDDNYDLKSLEEVEEFIEANNHLPEIPSEKEVIENGIHVAEMNAKLLQKIEELTLYVIDMNKEIKLLKQENTELKETINQ